MERRSSRALLSVACLLASALAIVTMGGGSARGERSQKGNVISYLKGGISPLALPRDRPVPVAVHLEGGLQTADRTTLPRVTRVELGLPSKGVVSTHGLLACPRRLLEDAKPQEALTACRDALVGRGRLQAHISLPNQRPFVIDARVLAFNGRVAGGRAVLLHAYAADPPTVAVLPLRLHMRQGGGAFGLALVGNPSPSLGPWPRLGRFQLTLFRRYRYRGRVHSYLSASCPIPKRNTAGFYYAKVTFGLSGGGRISTLMTRSCRAR